MFRRRNVEKKIEISSSDFIKKFIKNFILNGLIIGIVIAIIYEIINSIVANSILKDILYFILLFFTINQIYISAIKDTLYDSYLIGDNIKKSKNNVTILFVIIAIVNLCWNLFNLLRANSLLGTFTSFYVLPSIVNIIINIALYTSIIVLCRNYINKECIKTDKENKKYIVINTIVIIVFALVVGIATIITNTNLGNNRETNNLINNNSSENDELKENNAGDVTTIKTTFLNEIDCELSEDTVSQYQNVSKDHFDTNDKKVEINISSFNINVSKQNVYNEQNVEDGVILFYNGIEKNYIEKFDLDGKTSWKTETPSNYKFYKFMEVIDGYFMLGTNGNNSIITKMNKQGQIINVKYAENLSDEIFINSDVNISNGSVEVIGLDNEGNNTIIKYDKNGNQEKVIKTKLSNLACNKVIENNGYYYGIGADSSKDIYQREITIIFKIDNNGNEIFKYDILKSNTFTKYIQYNSWIEDIAVNNKNIFILTTNEDDIYGLNLNGQLEKKFGYNTNKVLNNGYHSSIENIYATDYGIYVYGNTIGNNIDKISNDFKFEYRINIPDTKLFPKSTTVNPIKSNKLTRNMYLDAELYDESSIIVYRYKFN